MDKKTKLLLPTMKSRRFCHHDYEKFESLLSRYKRMDLLAFFVSRVTFPMLQYHTPMASAFSLQFTDYVPVDT
jgi:hypothetical protein